MRRPLTGIAAVVGSVLLFYAIAPEPKGERQFGVGFFDRDPAVVAARTQLWALGDSVRLLTWDLIRVNAWETARALPTESAPTKFVALPGVHPNVVKSFEAAARAAFAEVPAPRVPLRVVLMATEEQGGFYRKYAVLPQEASQPCVVVLTVSPRARNLQPSRFDRLLATCGFYARFGRPSAAMQQWLERTRGTAAIFDSTELVTGSTRPRRTLQGSSIGFSPAIAMCLAGKDEGCVGTVVDPLGTAGQRQLIPPNERTSAVIATYPMTMSSTPENTLASIRAFVGDARFEQLWTTDADPAVGFEKVTGEHIAVFARPRLLNEYLPHEPGPLRGALDLVFGLSLGAAAAVWAIRRSRRERS